MIDYLKQLTYIDTQDLEVGDTVGLIFENISLYRSYKYPIIKEVKVTKITPKKTKIWLNGTEYNTRNLYSRIVKLDQFAKIVDRYAKVYKDTDTLCFRLERYNTKHGIRFDLKDIEHEDILKIRQLTLYLGRKYFNKEELFEGLYYNYNKTEEE